MAEIMGLVEKTFDKTSDAFKNSGAGLPTGGRQEDRAR